MTSSASLRPGAADLTRIVLGWGAAVLLLVSGGLLAPPVPGLPLAVALLGLVAVVIVCAFGVVKQAEALARRLGNPYGTLVLTLSVVIIEVVLIAAVMLGPGSHASIARDSVVAVSMIILNLVVGLCLVLGGLRHGGLRHHHTGTSAYLVMLIALTTVGFALPALIGEDGAFTPAQQIPVVVLTAGLYVFFLMRQLGPQAGDFREVIPADASAPARHDGGRPASPSLAEVIAGHRRELLSGAALLVLTLVPIVLLSHGMATLLDDGLGRVGAPPALSGVIIALIVFLPESLTAIRAALAGEIQRVSNLCHGALVSTLGLTIPSVLVIGLVTAQPVLLAGSPTDLALLGASLLLSVATFSAPRVGAVHGAAHLALFAAYGIMLLG